MSTHVHDITLHGPTAQIYRLEEQCPKVPSSINILSTQQGVMLLFPVALLLSNDQVSVQNTLQIGQVGYNLLSPENCNKQV